MMKFHRKLFRYLAVSTCDLCESPEGFVDRLRIGKHIRDIGIEHHYFGHLGVPLRVLSAQSLAEIILVRHLRAAFLARCFLHGVSSLESAR
jgi:hypothetical protein